MTEAEIRREAVKRARDAVSSFPLWKLQILMRDLNKPHLAVQLGADALRSLGIPYSVEGAEAYEEGFRSVLEPYLDK